MLSAGLVLQEAEDTGLPLESAMRLADEASRRAAKASLNLVRGQTDWHYKTGLATLKSIKPHLVALGISAGTKALYVALNAARVQDWAAAGQAAQDVRKAIDEWKAQAEKGGNGV